jgi:transcriptional regulator with XRE-family HTH domain
MTDLKNFIETKNLTQREFAIKIGYSEEYLSRVLNGKIHLKIKLIAAIHKVFPDFNTNLNEMPSINQNTMSLPKFNHGIGFNHGKITRNIPLITRYTYASYVEHYNDQEFLDSMEQIPTQQIEDGNYIWVEVLNDSMQREFDPSINPKDHVLVQELDQQNWSSLQLKMKKVWSLTIKNLAY